MSFILGAVVGFVIATFISHAKFLRIQKASREAYANLRDQIRLLKNDLTVEKKADIQRLLDMTGVLAIAQQMTSQIMVQLTRDLKDRRPDIPQRVIDVLRQEVHGVLRDKLPAFVETVAPLYHRYFTHDDIRGMIQFYSTELGQKVIRVLPPLVQDTMRAGQQWGQSLGPELDRRIKECLKAEGIELARANPNHETQSTAVARLRYAGGD